MTPIGSIFVEKFVHNFGRYHKYTIGNELREKSREILQLIRQANNATDKAETLLQLRERLEDLKLTIRLCKDLKAFANFNSFQYSINEVVNLSRQNEGWLKSAQKQGRPDSASSPGEKPERAYR